MLRFYGRPLDAPVSVHDGTHRSATPAATWRRFAPARKRAGITRIAELTGLDTLGIPVFAAIRPMGRSLSTQQGKGLTPDAARVSALMESLETWTAEELAVPIVRGSYRALAKRRRVVDVRRLPRTGAKLDPGARWDWVEGFELVAGEPILVPAQAVTLDTTFTKPPVFDISSNGLASGNALVEAIVHGLCEVIERDAEAAWRRTGGDRRLVLDTIDDRACRDLIDAIVRAGSRVIVWDLASRVGLCAIGCAIVEDPREPAWRALGVYQGFGAHLAPEIAIARALTEAAQTRLTYIAGGRDDFFAADYARATDRELLAATWASLPDGEPVLFDELPRFAARSLGGELELLVELVRAVGFAQVIAVELTHPALGVPVAKVIVPGLACDVEVLG
ncbi:MAG TPA: YcaO-like family protein [Kofleriaceae bacterium]|jgi:ribosomal protein S12 methylthiotransferase accessory factor